MSYEVIAILMFATMMLMIVFVGWVAGDRAGDMW